MYLEEIGILLAGFSGMLIARMIIKLTYVLVIKFITNTYHWLCKMLSKCMKQKRKKELK